MGKTLRERVKCKPEIEKPKTFGIPNDIFYDNIERYRLILSNSLDTFFCLMNALNEILNVLQKEMVISNTVQFKARVKDPISSLNAIYTGEGIGDLYGMEFSSANEEEKEILILLVHRLFDKTAKIPLRSKNHNKKNGYEAHHCCGILQKEINPNDFFNGINEFIQNSIVKQIKKKYTDSSITPEEIKKIPEDELKETVYLFPNLRKEGPKKLLSDNIRKAFEQAIKKYNDIMKECEHFDLPVEIQFKTIKVAINAINGDASHHDYKPILGTQEDIIQKFRTCSLMRGIHFPFKFQRYIYPDREGGGLYLQPTKITLKEMWPFLKDEIPKFEHQHSIKNNDSSISVFPILNYDRHIAAVFPELVPYVNQLSLYEKSMKVSMPSKALNEDEKKSIIWQRVVGIALRKNFRLREINEKGRHR